MVMLLGLATVAFMRLDFFGVFVTESIMHVVMPRPQFYSQIDKEPSAAFQSTAELVADGFAHFDRLEVFGTSTFSSLRTDSDAAVTELVRDKLRLCSLLRLVHAAEGQLNTRGEQNDFLVESFCAHAESSVRTFYYFHRPSLTKYGPYQWLWDSCFHIMISSRRSAVPAILELFSLFTFQHATGFVPEMTYWHADPNQGGVGGFLFGYSDARFTDITQMPMLAYPVEQLHTILAGLGVHGQRHLADDFARIFFLRVTRYIHYWQTHRDPDNDSLVSIYHPWESGLDASPLYDEAHDGALAFAHPVQPLALYPKFIVLLYRYRHHLGWDLAKIQRFEHRFDVEDIGVNSVLLDNAAIVRRLSHSKPSALYLQALDRIFIAPSGSPAKLLSYGWSPDHHRKIPLTPKTVQRLLVLLLTSDGVAESTDPLWTESILRTEAMLLAELADPVLFALPFGVPTAAKSEAEFDPNDSTLMWRGPTWPTTNWYAVRALTEIVDRDCSLLRSHSAECAANQRRAEALLLDLATSWTSLHLLHGFSEYFNPVTGEPLGQRNLGMSIILVDYLAPLLPNALCDVCQSNRHGPHAASIKIWQKAVAAASRAA